ncbi:MAG: Fe-S cluster biogenesis protein NfuA [Myxococcota bacterium]|jgi:Fe-S cluster biogenesis protein NfuA
MGIRTRIKGIIKTQAKERLGMFNIRSDAPPPPSWQPPPEPATRTIIRPKIVVPSIEVSDTTDVVRIRAQASRDGRQCALHADHPVLDGLSWWFERPEPETVPAMVGELLAIEGVVSVHVDGGTVTMVRGAELDWRAVSALAAPIVRKQLDGGSDLLAADVIAEIPAEAEIRDQLQVILDTEVNPGVAAHSGHITLESVSGNTISIKMGGGCQGCSAADLTLRRGVHLAFRKAIPTLGAIYDATDHAAGQNPYFTE